MNSQTFTGERFIPGEGGPQIAYEHIHRYLFARRLAEGKHVLDVAAGEGYGTDLLAQVAGHVWGTDIDGSAIGLARIRYPRSNLEFLRADATQLPIRSGSIDLVVGFEVLEHVRDQERMIREMARVSLPGGAALISTPDKATYSDARGYANPFHVHELYESEFQELLGRHFPNVMLMKQQMRAGSLISPAGDFDGDGHLAAVSLASGEQPHAQPMYLLAVCDDGKKDLRSAGLSAYLDPSDAFLEEWRGRVKGLDAEVVRLNGEMSRLDTELKRMGSWGHELEAEVSKRDEALRRTMQKLDEVISARDDIIRKLQKQMDSEITSRDSEIKRIQEQFDERTAWALSMQGEVAGRDELLRQTTELLERTDGDLRRVERHLASIRNAFIYRILCKLGILPR